jgi:hypothetical protein
MKRLGLIIVCIVTIVFVVSIGCGCRLPIKAVPGPGRNGRLYCYTEDYSDRYFPFCLYGKSLIASKGDGSWEIIPPPTAIFPGIPLFFLEKYIICPVIDTVMIPYDFYLKIQNAKVCENDGVFIKVVDVSGKPVQGVDVKISIGAKNGYRIVYGGKACHKWMYQEVIKSDVHGEVYVPVDIETCSEIRFSGQWKTTNGCDLFDGKIDCQYFNENISYWIRNGGDEARILFWGDRYLPGEYLKISMRCPRCLSRGIVRELDDKWRLTGECVKCGKKDNLIGISVENGGMICDECSNSVKDTIKLSASAIYTLQYIMFSTIEKLYSFSVTEEVIKEIEFVMRCYLGRYVDKQFKSMEMLEVF